MGMSVIQSSGKVIARELRGATTREMAECLLRIVASINIDGDVDELREAIREVRDRLFDGSEDAVINALVGTFFPDLLAKAKAHREAEAAEAAANPRRREED